MTIQNPDGKPIDPRLIQAYVNLAKSFCVREPIKLAAKMFLLVEKMRQADVSTMTPAEVRKAKKATSAAVIKLIEDTVQSEIH